MPPRVRHLTTEELAERIGGKTTPRTVEDWRLDGKGPRYIRVGRTIRYREADVEAWELAHLVEPANA
jgi:predicted DNA-binding transcriptional regulator AlpA